MQTSQEYAKNISIEKSDKISTRLRNSTLITAMVLEMALSDGWTDLDKLSEEQPEILGKYIQLAGAGLRAIVATGKLTK